MNVLIIANGAPDDAYPVDWPPDWRLPVVGERLKLPAIHDTTLEVASVVWAVMTPDGTPDPMWVCELWVWGPALSASKR